MSIAKLGEFGLIERFRKSIKTDSSVVKGSGDDCAVMEFDKNRHMLFTCDMLVEGLDFLPSAEPELIGRKALAVSISDIAACGGIPRYCLVSLGLPKTFSLKKADKIAAGLFGLAAEYKINIVGGDLSGSGKLVINVALLGLVEKKNLVLRSRAKKGDIIFVSGSFGGSLRGKHLRFRPRLKEARFLVKNFKINSMIDVSDGLSQDLAHILKQSKVGAVIYENMIPLAKEASGLKDALCGGEDFELLFSLSLTQAKRLIARDHSRFRPIGEVVDKRYGLRLVDKRCREKPISIKGFRHF